MRKNRNRNTENCDISELERNFIVSTRLQFLIALNRGSLAIEYFSLHDRKTRLKAYVKFSIIATISEIRRNEIEILCEKFLFN